MKKIILFAATLFATTAMMAQTYVSTTPENKNVVLEEFTGVNCGYCPDGHDISNQVCAANAGHAWAINIHTGGYAAEYTTQWGAALNNQAHISGYPAGTVNRHVFSGSSTELNRGQWASAANQIRGQQSPVNIAARATVDYNTRVMTIDVEIYYTANSSSNVNYLNIALLQDNILGQQSNYGNYNSDYIEGNQYRHMHMLRDLITGQWGEAIETTSAGSFVHKTYTYNVPASIQNAEYNTSHSFPVEIEDISLICFVCEGHQEILSACEAELSIEGVRPDIAQLTENVIYDCNVAFSANAQVKNLGSDTITSARIAYSIDGVADTFNYTGMILPRTKTNVTLPTLSNNFVSGQEYTLTSQLVDINGEATDGVVRSATMSKTVYDVPGVLNFNLVSDRYASEISYKLYRADGSVVKAGGPWGNGHSDNVKPYSYNFNLTPGCYYLEIEDSYGDGINNGHGAGYISLGSDGNEFYHHNGEAFSLIRIFLNVTNNGNGTVEIAEADNSQLAIYPNPATNVLNISSSDEVTGVEVFDLAGRKVMSEMGNVNVISLNNLAKGVYTIRVNTVNGLQVQKFVKE